jgi:hypothetical protein
MPAGQGERFGAMGFSGRRRKPRLAKVAQRGCPLLTALVPRCSFGRSSIIFAIKK